MSDDTIFAKIIRGELPADKVYEDDDVLAFRDINAAAPVHILVIPKKPIVNLYDAAPEDAELLGKTLIAARIVAEEQGLESFRIVANNGADAGQSVFHLHFHVIGGRDLRWPPG